MRIKRSARFSLCEMIFTRKWSFLGPGSEKKLYSIHEYKPQGEWDRVAELMMLKFGESKHPVIRSTSPLSRGVLKSKGGGKLSIHFCVDGETVETVLRTIISVNRLSIYGAVSDLCEEYSTCQTRTERPVLAGQSDPLFAPSNLLIMTPRLSIGIPAQGHLLRNKIDWSRRRTVLYEKTHAEPVTCREFTLPRADKSADPKGRIRGIIKIGPVLETTNQLLAR